MRILFGVQGTGNGHISRCRTLAKALNKQHAEVDYIFSGRPPEDYFDMADFGHYRTFRGMSFETQNGKINLRKTIQKIRTFRLIKDIRELDLSEYDCIISDFEPVSAWSANIQKLDCIGISNQASSQYLQPKAYNLIAKVIMKYYAPVTQPVGLHWFHFGQPLLPPIIDPLQASDENGSIVVYLPFESLHDINALLTAFDQYTFRCFHPEVSTPQQIGHIHLLPLGREGFTQALAECSGIIANTGFALISEALVLGKKILTKPVTGQFEQTYNADCLQQLSLATVMDNLDSEVLNQWLPLPSPTPVSYPNVAEELAKWLVSDRKEPLVSLSKRLWQQTTFPQPVTEQIQKLGYALK